MGHKVLTADIPCRCEAAMTKKQRWQVRVPPRSSAHTSRDRSSIPQQQHGLATPTSPLVGVTLFLVLLQTQPSQHRLLPQHRRARLIALCLGNTV